MSKPLFQVNLPFAPIPFRYAGKQTLVYETLLANENSNKWIIRQIDIYDPTDETRLISRWDSKEIEENSRIISPAYRPVETKILELGLVCLAYHWITLNAEAGVPPVLRHEYLLEDEQGKQECVVLDIPVQTDKPVTIQPPLSGKHWVASDAASNTTGHRRTPILLDGVPYFAQRYAVDWIQFGQEGKLYKDTPERNENWYCYGADVMVVAEGVVTHVMDGIIENIPLEKPAIEITLDTAPGNAVIIDMGSDHYAFYAHLQPGSISVKVGDPVRCGQVIGKLGNSGNSDAPHLHFHIGNQNSPLGSQGLPYHFPQYERIGNTGDSDEFFKQVMENKAWNGEQPAEIRKDEYMHSNDVINFIQLH